MGDLLVLGDEGEHVEDGFSPASADPGHVCFVDVGHVGGEAFAAGREVQFVPFGVGELSHAPQQ